MASIITLLNHKENKVNKTIGRNDDDIIYDFELKRCATCKDFLERLDKLEFSYFIILTNNKSIKQGLYVFNKIMKIIIKCDYYPIQVVKSDTYGENCIETIRFNSADVIKNMSLRISSFTKLRMGSGNYSTYEIYTAIRNFTDTVVSPIDIDITRSYKSNKPFEDWNYHTYRSMKENDVLILSRPIDKHIEKNGDVINNINELVISYMLYHCPNQNENDTKYFRFKEFNGRRYTGRRYICNSYSHQAEQELRKEIFKEMFMLHHKKINVFMVIDIMIEITNLDKDYMLYKLLQEVKEAIDLYNQKMIDVELIN